MLRDSTDATDEEIYKLTSNIHVVDDHRMPYTDDGPIDILMNSSGAVRRLNPGQLCEVEMNFIGEELRKVICKKKTIEEKEELIFKFMDILNKDQSTFFLNMYEGYNQMRAIDGHEIRFIAPETRRAFIEDVEKNGFYIVRPPHHPLLYKDIMALYEAFPFIKPIPLYIDLFGIKHRRIIKDGVCGTQYVVVLKQNSNKNFSARSTFRVNRSNLPAKDVTKKTNRSSYARTPVRLSEIYNLFSSISGETLAEYNIFMRSSPIGSKSLDRILSADGNPLKIRKLKVQDNYTNSNAQILAARLKAIGVGIEFTTPEDERKAYPPDTVVEMNFYGKSIVDSWNKHDMYQDLFDRFMKLDRSFQMVQEYRGQKEEYCWEKVFEETKDLYDLSDQDKANLIAVTKPLSQSLLEIKNSDEVKPVRTGKKRGRKPKNYNAMEAMVKEIVEQNDRELEEMDDDDTSELKDM